MDWFYAWSNNTEFIRRLYPECLSYVFAKTCDVLLYNFSNSIKDRNNINNTYELKKYITNYRFQLLFCSKISVTRKLRLVVALLSDLNKENCLYIRIYGKRDKNN